MDKLNKLLQDLDISKVALAKYLGVSRQMIYNYLSNDGINKMPTEKKEKLFELLGVKNEKETGKIKITPEYRIEVDNRLNDKIVSNNNLSMVNENGLGEEKNTLLNNIYSMIKEKLVDDKNEVNYKSFVYLYHFLQSMDASKELKYILAYISKSTGFTDPTQYAFSEDPQFIFESIMYSAMTLYTNGGASKSKLAESHKRWENEIEQKKEDKLSRTQQLNSAKTQALRELGYTEINENNAGEVLEKIAEIQSRFIS